MKYLKYGEIINGKEQIKHVNVTFIFNPSSLVDSTIMPWKLIIISIDSKFKKFKTHIRQLIVLNAPWETTKSSILFKNVCILIDENIIATIYLSS